MTTSDTLLHRAVGLADLFELLSMAFAYPTEYTAQALADGAFMSDWHACWQDATGDDFDAQAAGFADAPLGHEPDGYEPLRREYSRLYLLPGKLVPIWPYEGAFKYRERGHDDAPGLFRTRTCLDVEGQMKAAGVITSDARTVPADSVDKELEFMAYLLGSRAQVVAESLGEQAGEPAVANPDAAQAAIDEWAGRCEQFARTHVLNWMEGFMAQTIELTRLDTYRDLSRLAQCALGLLAAEFGSED